ncbi:MAG: SDR family oxidoreductase [Eubacterium ramulus]
MHLLNGKIHLSMHMVLLCHLISKEKLILHTTPFRLNTLLLQENIQEIYNIHGHIDTVFCIIPDSVPEINVTDLTPELLQQAMLKTTYCAWKSTLYAVPYLKNATHGSVIFITSNSHRHISPDNSLSSLCSASIESITKNFASEVAAFGIRICSVAADIRATPDQIASCAMFLASEQASYITGTCDRSQPITLKQLFYIYHGGKQNEY